MAEDRDIGLDVAEDSYRIRLDEFEGPLDLLLHLIKKNEVNIYDIPIALITAQYLATIELMQEMNLDIAGDYLVMATPTIRATCSSSAFWSTRSSRTPPGCFMSASSCGRRSGCGPTAALPRSR